ncbi:MAG: TRAP transporter large permease [Clostridiales Family XIII bacterium]|jgi:TRAP-type C4-dicarboxylate transport system permease large subunit|nr:TRAP transporter large permease [Clostridiales Family XIII bacterium]
MATELIFIVAVLLVALFVGTPVSTALGVTALAAMLIFMAPSHVIRFGVMGYIQGTSANQMVAPLFILMAEFLAQGGIARDIYDLLSRLLHRLRGGLAISTTLACTVFAALCGSSPATAAAIGRISISQMTERGYAPSFAVGTVAAGGTLGIMIPPSLTFVLYGIITETSIAKLLMAGLLPGLMLSAMFIVFIIIRSFVNPSLTGDKYRGGKRGAPLPGGAFPAAGGEDGAAGTALQEAEGKSMGRLLAATAPAMALIVLVLGALYTGLATPTESAGIGALGALAIVLARRRLTREGFGSIIRAAVKTSVMILFMIIFGMVLSYVISYLGISQMLAGFIVGAGLGRWAVMALLFVLWFVMGCLMDPGSMVILTIPFIYPALMAMGFDSIWLGIVSTLCVEIGMITPPVGLNLFVLRSVSEIEMKVIIRGAVPYVGVLIVALVILCIFPNIALLLPSLM